MPAPARLWLSLSPRLSTTGALALVATAAVTSCAPPAPPTTTPAPALAEPQPTELDAVAFSQRWIEDDYPRALAEAKKSHKAVFVDAWASFCHTCLHMREVVLDDPRLRPLDKDVVWLSIEVDRPTNEAFVKAHAAKALPTFFVLDEDGNERARWVGAMDGDGVARFVRGGVAPDPALARVTDLYLNKKLDECVRVASFPTQAIPTYGDLAVLTTGLACATDAAGDLASCKDTAATPCANLRALRQRVSETTKGLRHDAPATQLEHADDLSSAYETLLDARAVVSAAESAADAAAWVSFLDDLAARAPSRERRAAFDAHRVLAYLAAGAPERALPMLRQTQAEFPEDYNPPARLAVIYRALHQLPEAIAANAQALSRVYGPRTLRVYAQRADLFREQGNQVDERATLEEALRWAEGRWLPESGRRTLEGLRRRLGELVAPKP